MFDADFTPPPSTRQLYFAREIAARIGRAIPAETRGDRDALSGWISRHRAEFEERRAANTGGARATPKQVGFAEKLSNACAVGGFWLLWLEKLGNAFGVGVVWLLRVLRCR